MVAVTQPVITFSEGRRRLCFYLHLSVCFSVCLSARLLKKLLMDSDEIFGEWSVAQGTID